ncbi:MAG: peptidoglycan glycosyltransferase [Ruminococcaceae bacterium]|nr:peptidoglycan glycosyltransferase [Oscillospiraceae bacterium]
MNSKKVTFILVLFSALFLSLVVYLTGIELYYKDEYASSNLNQRSLAREENSLRGTIYDKNGETLAYSKMEGDVQKRYYPHISLYSHVIGYSSKTYGKSMLEKRYNADLLGDNGVSAVFNLKNMLSGEMNEGNSLTLTIDHRVQKRINDMMGRYNGAAVAIDPKTGAILAMVSKPDFNPNDTYLKKSWQSLTDSDDAPFLSRAVMGLYPPGSTYKMLTASLIYENGLEGTEVEDEGRITIDGKEFTNTKQKAYGKTSLEDAFRVSSNVYFASVGSQIGTAKHRNLAERFWFNKPLEFDLPYSKSKYQSGSMEEVELAAASIGQGKTLVTPLQLAMMTAAIANDGVMMKPYLVQEIKAPGGFITKNTRPAELSHAVDVETARAVKELMVDAVNNGTGTNARIWGIDVGGKTGTAENERTNEDSEATHALFVSFAPADDPQIAVAVILEYAGNTGGSIAAPIAREAMRTYLKK